MPHVAIFTIEVEYPDHIQELLNRENMPFPKEAFEYDNTFYIALQKALIPLTHIFKISHWDGAEHDFAE